jgi:ABC-type bacteriocin/lantibiotic exporter with double-glycine peptidase domain
LIHRAQSRFICNAATRLSRNKLKEYLEGRYENYVNVDSAVHIRKISYQPIDFAQHILGGIQQAITQSVLIILTITIMIFFNARIFLFLFLILLPPVIAVFYVIKARLRSVKTHSQISIERSWQNLREALSGFIESNIYNKNGFFLDRYIRHQQDFNKYVSDLLIIQGIPSRMIEIFAWLGLFFLIAINKWSGASDSSAIVTGGAFIAAAYKIIPGIVKILNTGGQISNYACTIRDLQPATDPNVRKTEILTGNNIEFILLKDISFQYNGANLLNNISITMQPGDFLGISGCSGTGKTTILNLLLGFLTPCAGEISINGMTSDPTTIQNYWKNISYVRQQPFLIHDSISRNIILDNPHNEERLQEVIRVAGLQELINTFPEAHEKIIIENGKNLSGGQRQRIAIARALYKNAGLILLDEPFNELDETTELAFLSHFQYLAQHGKMIILITHNKASFSHCNKMISLDEHQS